MRLRSIGRIIFLVSPFVPTPPSRGIELRILRLLEWMSSAGFRVVLIISTDTIDEEALRELRPITHAIHWTKPAMRTRLGKRLPRLREAMWLPLKALLTRLQPNSDSIKSTQSVTSIARSELPGQHGMRGVQCDGHDQVWSASPELVVLVGRLAHRYKPHAVIVEYIFATPVFELLPETTIKIIDTIDVFSRKQEQVLAFGIADPLACTEEEERLQLLKADVIVAIQSREMALLQALVPEREVILAGIDVEVVDSSASDASVADTVVVVASDNALNVHGLKTFLAECWPLIKAEHSSATLHIVGRVGEQCVVNDSSIRYSGWVGNLDRVYSEASVVINPTIAGTGLKIKSVQALAHGKPLVAWSNGVEGLDYQGDPPFIECHSWIQFATSVVSLLVSKTDRAELAQRALAFSRREFAAAKVYSSLDEMLSRLASSSQPRLGSSD